jgi:hypothetical protein
MPETLSRILRIDLPPEFKSIVGNALLGSGVHAFLQKQKCMIEPFIR